eukprot:6172910-Pleurochrysis_carterae.AAC.3
MTNGSTCIPPRLHATGSCTRARASLLTHPCTASWQTVRVRFSFKTQMFNDAQRLGTPSHLDI